MFRIALINMPFGELINPSLGLTQLKTVVAQNLSGRAQADIHYLNHELAQHLGQAYRLPDPLGEWLFRPLAFPDAADNTDFFLRRFKYLFPPDHMPQVFDNLVKHRDRFPALLDQWIDRYGLDRYDVVGFTLLFCQCLPSVALARQLKKRNPRQTIVFGGVHCDTPMGSVLIKNVDAADFVFCGPSLVSFPAFIQCMIENRHGDCDAIPGVLSRQKLAQRSSALQEIGEELDINHEIPLEYDGFLDSIESLKHKLPGLRPRLFFETSRGCWWGERSQCAFCGINGSTLRYRIMAPQKALAQFKRLFDYFPRCREFHAVDNVIPKEYLTEVLPHLHTPEGARLFYEVRPELSNDQMDTLARARVTEVNVGLEALNTSALRLMRKGVNAFQNIHFLKNAARLKLRTCWLVIIGSLGEEQDVYRKYLQDFPRLFHLPPPGAIVSLRFDRYSHYFREADHYGLDLKVGDYYRVLYPFNEEDSKNLAYCFDDPVRSIPNNRVLQDWLHRLQRATVPWKARHIPRLHPTPPELTARWDGDSLIVRDTRQSTQSLDHRFDTTDARVLALLESPFDLVGLQRRLPDLEPLDLEHRVDGLRAKDLLFEEGPRMMSLVVGGAPPRPHRRAPVIGPERHQPCPPVDSVRGAERVGAYPLRQAP